MEMALRRPNRLKAIFIGKFRPFQQQSIGVMPRAGGLGRKVKQTETWAVAAFSTVGLQNDGDPARQGPENLQH